MRPRLLGPLIPPIDPDLLHNILSPPVASHTQPPIPLYPTTPAMADHADDLHAEQTEGFKVGEKKTIDEYQKLGTWQPPSRGQPIQTA